MSATLTLFVVYRDEQGHEGRFTVRKNVASASGVQVGTPLISTEGIDEARSVIPSGYVRMDRDPADDATIFEVWI